MAKSNIPTGGIVAASAALVAGAFGWLFFGKKKPKYVAPPVVRRAVTKAPSVTAASPPDPRIKRRNDMVKMWADIKSGKLANLYNSVDWLTRWTGTLTEPYVQDIKQEALARIAVLKKPAPAPAAPPPAPPNPIAQATAAANTVADAAGSISAGFNASVDLGAKLGL